MLGLIRRFRCGKCGEVRGVGRRALESPWRPRLGVCRDCLQQWERTGHRCGRCWAQIRDRLEVGLLVETRVFAHVDCGAALLADAGPPAAAVGPRLSRAGLLGGLRRLLGWRRLGFQGGER
jgi:hypothetical protein